MISNIINLNIECIKLLLVMCGIFNFKLQKSLWATILLVGSNLALVIGGVVDNEYQVSAFLYIVILISGLFVKGKRRFMFSFFSFWGICCLDGLILVIVQEIFDISDKKLTYNPMLVSAINTLSIVVLALGAVIIHKFFYKKKESSQRILSNADIVYIVMSEMGLISTLIFISPFIYPEYEFSVRNKQIVTIFASLLGILFLVIGILLLYNSHSKNNYKKLYELNQRLLEMQKNYYQMLLEKENETRRFRHDIDNHILCVQTLIKDNKDAALEYLATLREKTNDLKIDYQTGNMLVNVIVNDICNKYRQVAFDWKGRLPENVRISNMDICIIFSNVLENAFHAAAECKEGVVSVKVKMLENSVYIQVDNNMITKIKESKGRFITSKIDKLNHGYGVENVKTCIKENGGAVVYTYTDNCFTTEIIFPNIV